MAVLASSCRLPRKPTSGRASPLRLPHCQRLLFQRRDSVEGLQSGTPGLARHARSLAGLAHLLHRYRHATGTAFYMFRSYYMTFTGEYRGGHGHDGAPAHGHGPKESPLSITSVLVVLASGAVLASLIGLPASWTHRPPILEHFLEPSLPATVAFVEYRTGWSGCSRSSACRRAIGWLFARLLYLNGRALCRPNSSYAGSALDGRLQQILP